MAFTVQPLTRRAPAGTTSAEVELAILDKAALRRVCSALFALTLDCERRGMRQVAHEITDCIRMIRDDRGTFRLHDFLIIAQESILDDEPEDNQISGLGRVCLVQGWIWAVAYVTAASAALEVALWPRRLS